MSVGLIAVSYQSDPGVQAKYVEEVKDPKKVKVSHSSHGKEKGLVLVLGQGDVGQLGFGRGHHGEEEAGPGDPA
ncbi:hypothetical protein J4Q44_G00016370 [Coregonus suidteri]|uniref:Uncharacterized protein n=1 Tax=Coregonus suidteri TaxID=861788 RepID=A0AAN8M882_9TELE